MQAQGKKKQIPIFGYFRVFKEYPQKSQIWKCETSPNQGTLLGIPWLGLVLLCQIWDFYGYSLNTLKFEGSPEESRRLYEAWAPQSQRNKQNKMKFAE